MIQIPTFQERERNYERFITQLPEIAYEVLSALARDLLEIIKSRMRHDAYDFTKVINAVNISVVRRGGSVIRISVDSPYERTESNPDGTPRIKKIAEYLEKGTDTHYLAPRWAPLLKWKDKLTGVWRSSEGHYVSGVRATKIMKHVINEYTPAINDKLEKYIMSFRSAMIYETQLPQISEVRL